MATTRTYGAVGAFETASLTPQERLTRSGGWFTFVLAMILLASVAEGVYAAGWSEGLEVVRLAVVGGGLLGCALALTRFGSLFAALYGILAGVFWVTVSLHRVLLPEMSAHDAVQELLLRNAGWFVALTRGGAGADNLVFVTQLSVLGWCLGFFASWNLFRHQRLLYAAAPAGIALLINLYYSPINLTGYLLVFLVMLLLLAMRIELARNETRWQISRIRYAPDIYIDFLKAGLTFAAVVVLFSWAMPNVASRANLERLVRPLQGPWRSIEDTWSRMYQSLNYPGTAPQAIRYGKNLALGGPVQLSDRPMFEGQFARRTYWRAATYDQYDGRGWTNTDLETSIIEHGQWLGEPLFAATAELTATLRSLASGQETILAPPQPLRVSLPVDADFTRITEDAALVSVSQMRSRVALSSRLPYRIVSAVTQAPIDLLQTDNTEYPSWVTDRFLQLPESVPQRIVELAEQITAPQGNPYDKATAIERYLRSYTYSTQIDAPPDGMDAVDYFLFTTKQGYCDYFASAMVVMLRAVGIPSRVAAGYAPGELVSAPDGSSEVTDTYRVLERDAHAWVEVFFPTYGWIQFEPTVSQPLVQRLVARQTSVPTPAPLDLDDENLKDLRNRDLPESTELPSQLGLIRWLQNHWKGLALTAGVLALAVAAGFVVRRRQKAFLKSSELLAGLLGRAGIWAGRLAIPWPASHTPREHATQFGQNVPEADSVVGQIATLFAAQRYGRQQPSSEIVQTVATDWQRLQPVLWKRWLQRVVHAGATAPPVTPTPAERGPWQRDPGRAPQPRTSRRR